MTMRKTAREGQKGEVLVLGYAYYPCEPRLHLVPLWSFEWSLAVFSMTLTSLLAPDTFIKSRPLSN